MSLIAVQGAGPALREAVALARSHGHDVRVLQTVDDLVGDLGASYDAILLQATGQLSSLLAQLPLAVLSRMTLFVEQPTEADMLALATASPVAGVVAARRALTRDDIQPALSRALDKTLPGIERCFAGPPTIEQVVVTDSTRRGEALEALERFVRGFTTDTRRLAQALTVADELTTNALYHAPIDDNGRRPYSHLPRIDPLPARGNRSVHVTFARDPTRLAVSVRDEYGSLEPALVLRHLARAATDPAATFKVGSAPGGAGLGVITALRASSTLIFHIVPGRMTECVSVMEVGGTYREFLERGKCLQVLASR